MMARSTRHLGLVGLYACLVAPACTLAAAAVAKGGPPVHVVMVVADDLGFADLGITGSLISTPTIDALATAGIRLSNYYVQRVRRRPILPL